MFEIGEPPAKVLKVNNEDESLTDASNLSEGETMDIAETTEMSADSNVPESLAMAESLSMDGTEMVEERLQDSFDSQEPPGSQESQEEWLNEDVLTDDDFNPAAETADSQASQTDNSQSETSPLYHDTTELEKTELEQIVPEITKPDNKEPEPTKTDTTEPELKEQSEQTPPAKTDLMADKVKSSEQNIEDALNTLEGGLQKELDLPDLDAFLIKKTDLKGENAAKTDTKQEDDGNDTDDLLRMLGEDGSKKKKLTKTVKDVRVASKVEPPSSDDEFVFEGASNKKFKLAKSLVKKVPMKAEPEDDGTDTDQSSDEGSTVKKMFSSNSKKKVKQDVKPVPHEETHVKNIVSVKERPKKDKLATSTPLRPTRSVLRPPRTSSLIHNPPVQVKREPQLQTFSRQKPTLDTKTSSSTSVKTTSILKSSIKQEPKKKPEDIVEAEAENSQMVEEELESEFEDEMSKTRQRIMKPERMDEDVPSDEESHSEDGSLYDEIPSSESEDVGDWFQIDIRAEKAGDYLPLLGPKAKELLLEEKQRIVSRLATLKQSLGALTDSGKKQAEQVRSATMTLAELDDMLKS